MLTKEDAKVGKRVVCHQDGKTHHGVIKEVAGQDISIDYDDGGTGTVRIGDSTVTIEPSKA